MPCATTLKTAHVDTTTQSQFFGVIVKPKPSVRFPNPKLNWRQCQSSCTQHFAGNRITTSIHIVRDSWCGLQIYCKHTVSSRPSELGLKYCASQDTGVNWAFSCAMFFSTMTQYRPKFIQMFSPAIALRGTNFLDVDPPNDSLVGSSVRSLRRSVLAARTPRREFALYI